MTYLRAIFRRAVALGCDCKHCPLSTPPHRGPVFPAPPQRRSPLIIAGEGPGPSEETYQQYFCGPSGDFLDNMLEHYGIPRARLHITNVTMCKPTGELNDSQWAQALSCCRPRLVAELRKIQSKTILAFGERAFQVFTGHPANKQRHYQGLPYRGAEEFSKYHIVTTYHPAYVLRPENGAFVPSVWEFTKRAWDAANGRFSFKRWPKILVQPNDAAIDALEGIVKSGEPIGFDVETRGTDPLTSPCMCLAIAEQKVAVSLPWEGYKAIRDKFVAGLGEASRAKHLRRLVKKCLQQNPLVLQNGPHDLLTAERLGLIDPWKVHYIFDTLLAHSVVAPGMWHDLGYIAALETRLPRWKTAFHATTHEKGVEAFSRRDPLELRQYNARDAWVTLILRDYLEPRLDEQHAARKIFDQHMANIKVAMRMEKVGVPWDSERAQEHLKILLPRYKRARGELEQLGKLFDMSAFNPNSPLQMSTLLYQKLGVTVRRRSKKTGAPSTDEKALSDLIVHPNDLVRNVARSSLRFRKNQKLLGYLGWKKKGGEDVRIAENGRMHITWNPTGARTGRWSSSPNLQNIPKPVVKKNRRTGQSRILAPGLRDVFLPFKPGDWVVCADYDQLEMRIAALVTGDDALIDLFKAGGDPHRENAAAMFGYANPKDVSKDERDMAKIWYYQRMNNGTPEAIWKHVAVDFPNYTLKDSYNNRNAYDMKHPLLARWHDEAFREALRTKEVRTPISGLTLTFYSRVEASKVYSYTIQGAAADILNPRIATIGKKMDWTRTGILAQVHDELVLCGPDPIALAKLLQEVLTCDVTINGRTLTFTVGIKMGPSYGEVMELSKGESLAAGAKRIKKHYSARFASLKRWKPRSHINTQ